MKPNLEGIETIVIVGRTQLKYAQLRTSTHVFSPKSMRMHQKNEKVRCVKMEIWDWSGNKNPSVFENGCLNLRRYKVYPD